MSTTTVFRYLPKSFFNFVLIGFCIVALPLIAALMNDAIYVDRLFVHSQQAVYQAAQATQTSRMLSEQITAMERNARQYAVLGDPAFLVSYADRHIQFQEAAERLLQLLQQEFLRGQLETLLAKEQILFELLQNSDKNKLTSKETEQEFASLSPLAQTILQESNNYIDSQVDLMRQMTAETKENLLWQALAVVPGVIIFTVVFTVLISRPITQIDQAIRRIGEGNFDEPITVSGPRDLQYLGERLDWLRHRLSELEAKKSGFLRNVSHDLKTPLAAIRESCELLIDGVVGTLSEQQHEVLYILQKNTVHLQRMIESLLNFSLANRDANPNKSELELKALLKDIAADHKPVMLAKKIDLRLNCGEDITVFADKEQLRVIMDNLISNAVKYSPSHARIRVNVAERDARIIVDVQDNGPGIDSNDALRVFEPFYRGKSTEQGRIKGSGLGLSIAREFVLAHKGTIELVGADLGAHFRVTLPKN